MAKQVLIIHGGDNYETHEAYLKALRSFVINFAKDGLNQPGWKDNFQTALGDSYEVIRPEMPNKWNARYEEWKIWFEKFLPYLSDEIVLVGHSLGGSFLAKYLSTNNFSKKIQGLILIAPAHSDNLPDYKMLDFAVPNDLSNVSNQVNRIILYHSEDDPVVPFTDLQKFQLALPKAEIKIFKDRQHFTQSEIPELVKDIRSLF